MPNVHQSMFISTGTDHNIADKSFSPQSKDLNS